MRDAGEGRGREEMEHPSSLTPAALTPTNDHFCDYATGPRLLAANHKNDTGRCAMSRDLPISIRDRESDGKKERKTGVKQGPWQHVEHRQRRSEVKMHSKERNLGVSGLQGKENIQR